MTENRYAWGDWVRLTLVAGTPVVKVLGLGVEPFLKGDLIMGESVDGPQPYVQVDWGQGLRNILERFCEPFEPPPADPVQLERWLSA